MAVDEVLLEQAADEGLATLRFYRWSEPTLSLGYFQEYADREQHAASRNCAVVRRQSGGGAILHDRELTYSIALPGGHPLAQDASELYRGVHGAIIDMLQPELGSAGGRYLTIYKDPQVDPAREPFLCFERRAAGDIVLATKENNNYEGEFKIVGSAQRRRQSAVLQHGSILLDSSPAAPELPGLRDRSGLTLTAENLASALTSPLARLLEMRLARAAGAIEGMTQVEQLVGEKYGSPTWTKRR
jgi:lipoate-protein ligase A